jgi:hypothetical protein
VTGKTPAGALPAPTFTPATASAPSRRPMYWRLLRLRHVRPNGWHRALFVEGSLVVGGLLALAGVASAWTVVALPVVVAVLVKAHDVLLGAMATTTTATAAASSEPATTDPATDPSGPRAGRSGSAGPSGGSG